MNKSNSKEASPSFSKLIAAKADVHPWRQLWTPWTVRSQSPWWYNKRAFVLDFLLRCPFHEVPEHFVLHEANSIWYMFFFIWVLIKTMKKLWRKRISWHGIRFERTVIKWFLRSSRGRPTALVDCSVAMQAGWWPQPIPRIFLSQLGSVQFSNRIK